MEHLTDAPKGQGLLTCSLTRLPVELLLEIIYNLDLSSIAALRQICRTCCHVSKSSLLWTFLYRRYAALVSPARPRVLDRPFHSYTSDEVEQMVIRMASHEANWSLERPSVRSVQELKLPTDMKLLLPGGRWLLSVPDEYECHPRIVCYDLIHLERGPQPLFSYHGTEKSLMTLNIAYCIDGDAAGFQCDIAVSYAIRTWLTGQTFEDEGDRLAIWTISYGASEDRLVARHRRTIPIHGRFLNGYMTSIYGDKFVRGLKLPSKEPDILEIIYWDQSDFTSCMKSILSSDFNSYAETCSAVRLLPHNRLMFCISGGIEIFDIPPPQAVPPKDVSTRKSQAPIWTHQYRVSLASLSFTVSPPLVYSKSPAYPAVISICNIHSVHGIFIPDDLTKQRIAVSRCLLGSSDGTKVMLIGSRRGFWLEKYHTGETNLRLISFRPPEEARRIANFGLARSNLPLGNCDELVGTESSYVDPDGGWRTSGHWCFDEQSGTIVKRLRDTSRRYRILSFV